MARRARQSSCLPPTHAARRWKRRARYVVIEPDGARGTPSVVRRGMCGVRWRGVLRRLAVALVGTATGGLVGPVCRAGVLVPDLLPVDALVSIGLAVGVGRHGGPEVVRVLLGVRGGGAGTASV